ncbi:nucleoside hydrolase [Brevibacillus centrosporus]|nr:nucleoside hydrolase [Brevibacillus centrosporus]MEC2129882.1 nucleoside hydrolase [Brevibacillus centrosporus]RNB71823.1 nucleoside hydrolase [Brevibacillus centrosporus]
MSTLTGKQRLFIDCSGGSDQMIALWYALQSPATEIVGIGYSGDESGQGRALIQKCIEIVKPSAEIPVAMGDGASLFATPKVEGEGPARLLVEKAQEWKGELTVITLGSLTNLAKAAAIDPRLPEKVKQVVVQGGAIRVPGNVTAVAEKNMYADPEAAAFVWAAGFPLVLVPLDATERLRLTEEEGQAILAAAIQKGMLPASEEAGAQALRASARLDAWGAMVAAIHPEFIHKQQMKLSIECRSTLSRGAVLADLRKKPSVGIDTEVAAAVEGDSLREWLRGLCRAEGGSW